MDASPQAACDCVGSQTPRAEAKGQTARVMAAGGEPTTRRRPTLPCAAEKPASAQRLAALTAGVLRGAGGSLGGGGAGRTARPSNGRAPWARGAGERGGAALPLEGSGPRRTSSAPPRAPPRPAPPGSRALALLPPGSGRLRAGWRRSPVAPVRANLSPPLPGETCCLVAASFPFLLLPAVTLARGHLPGNPKDVHKRTRDSD